MQENPLGWQNHQTQTATEKGGKRIEEDREEGREKDEGTDGGRDRSKGGNQEGFRKDLRT